VNLLLHALFPELQFEHPFLPDSAIINSKVTKMYFCKRHCNCLLSFNKSVFCDCTQCTVYKTHYRQKWLIPFVDKCVGGR